MKSGGREVVGLDRVGRGAGRREEGGSRKQSERGEGGGDDGDGGGEGRGEAEEGNGVAGGTECRGVDKVRREV